MNKLIIFLCLISFPAFAGLKAIVNPQAPNGGSLITLGSSAASTNPQRSGDATTGFYSDTTATVSAACSGVNCITVNSTGVGVGTSLPAFHLQTLQPIASTVSTTAAQGGVGYYVPFASTTAMVAGQVVTGTSIPVNTIVSYSSNSSAPATTTANGAGSGNSVTVTSGTGIAVGDMIFDTTTPANVSNQCIVDFVSGVTVNSPCTLSSIANNDTLVFRPSITLSQITTSNIPSAQAVNFTNNGADASVNGINISGDANIGGAINLFSSNQNTGSGLQTGPAYSIITMNGIRFLNTFTPPGTNGGNLYMGTNSGPVFSNGGYSTQYNATNNTGFGQGGVLSVNTSGDSNSCFGYATCATLTVAERNSAFGTQTLNQDNVGGDNTGFGFNAALNNASGGSNTAVGSFTLLGTFGNSFSGDTVVGKGSYQSVTTGSNNIGLGTNVAFTCTTCATSIVIGNNVDVPSASVQNFFNIGNSIAGTIYAGTNPSICAVGSVCRLGHITAANFNVTTDQAITINALTSSTTGYLSSATKYMITEIDVGNCSATPGTAAGGFYTAASKGGTIIGATTTTFTNCTSSTTRHRLTGLTNEDTSLFTAATIYLSLTTTKGSAGTGDIDVYGVPYN